MSGALAMANAQLLQVAPVMASPTARSRLHSKGSGDSLEHCRIAGLTHIRSPAMHVAFDSVSSSSTGDASQEDERGTLEHLSKDVAMGLVLQAASGRGWTTGSGLEGPAFSDLEADNHPANESPTTSTWPQLSKSPRRRMRVAFTCNVCGERTMRAINPHAYTDGTVFVQCKGCDVFHKLVDNLNLFYEWDGRMYKTTSSSSLPTVNDVDARWML